MKLPIPDLNESIERFAETRLSSKLIYDGNLLKVHEDQSRLPDGSTARREWIKHPGACAIVPIFENGDTVLLRQYRYGPAKMFWEVPAGKIDPGEPIDDTARRELLEETGLDAREIQKIGHFYPAIGFCDEIIHIFIATGLSLLKSNTDEDEFVETVRMPLAQAFAMLDDGSIEDGKTCVVLQKVRSVMGIRYQDQ
jgi:ADP-ribose pyrophosphatase